MKNHDPFQGANVWTIDNAMRRINSALTSLGSTSGAVARRLSLMRCQGERSNPWFCPIIVFLRRQGVRNFQLTYLGKGKLEIMARDGWTEIIMVPPAVEWMAVRFDRGEFPELATESSGPGDAALRGETIEAFDHSEDADLMEHAA